MSPPETFGQFVKEQMKGLRSSGLLREDLFIGGEWLPATSAERFDITNPADGQVIASVACATEVDTSRAVQVAEQAMVAWSARTATERADVLMRWYELLLLHVDELATLLTAEQGKPVTEARGEIIYAAAFVRWFAEEARRSYGDVIPTNRSGRRLLAIRQPVGVVAAITPWNFPSLMIARKVAPALAAGCGVVLKPPSEAPLSALALAELGQRAGLPAGIFNVVHGHPEVVGPVLTSSPKIRMLTFTGSTEVGKLLMAQCATTVKRLALELGGNAPFIVFEDADLDEAVRGAIDAKFRNAGQTCVCANRFIVQSGISDEFIKRFVVAVAGLKVGNGFAPDVTIGPLIDEEAVAKVERHLQDATSRGARVESGGHRHELGGTFFEPTVLVDVKMSMEITLAETFGPVAPFLTFETEEEAIALANLTESGLASYFYTRDIGRIFRVSEALEFGVVGVNTGSISYEGAPFGGVKESGLGREGSRHGLDEFTELKYLCIDGI
jgi:succinate-semialdehyde dehydrogenase/glutarate-semialdehyde dehydrogenase